MLSFGAAIEVAQGAMGLGRDADVRDFAADAIGVAIALTVVYVGLGNWPSRIERIVGLSREPS